MSLKSTENSQVGHPFYFEFQGSSVSFADALAYSRGYKGRQLEDLKIKFILDRVKPGIRYLMQSLPQDIEITNPQIRSVLRSYMGPICDEVKTPKDFWTLMKAEPLRVLRSMGINLPLTREEYVAAGGVLDNLERKPAPAKSVEVGTASASIANFTQTFTS